MKATFAFTISELLANKGVQKTEIPSDLFSKYKSDPDRH